MVVTLDGRLVQYVTPTDYHILNGESPRNPEWGHAAVGLCGEVHFDPHPSRAGVTRIYDFEFLVPVNLDQLTDEKYRASMLRWLEQCPCICPACLPESLAILEPPG